ncbi:MAG: PRD domain-containing protein [Clostridia bacterium]|nr:PRD domain-containing protein [Clostridia bacterium]
MYAITKVINNNIICSVDENGNEVILRGLGIGFGRKKGERVEDEKIEKVYRAEGSKNINRLQQLFNEISIEYFDVCSEIISMAENEMNRNLNKNLLITLTDHIDFAVKRKKKGFEYKNALLSEIKNFYAVEFNIGKKAVNIINEKFGQMLSEDEAGFIALHIVNAELDTDMNNMVSITEMISAVTEIVSNYYGRELDKDSLDYSRFITHMKFFGQRVFMNKIADGGDSDIHNVIKEKYKKDYNCAVKIRGYISAKYNKIISEEEMVFLTVHLKRISM